MWGWIRRNRSAMSTLAVLAICVTIMFGVVASSKTRAYDYCPCGIGAAAVAATGASITSFTVALITELYLVLWQGFAAVNGQINANTASFEETGSYQTQVVANIERQELGYQATMNTLRPATIGFQTSATSGAGAAQLNTDLMRDALLAENHQWQTNMVLGTSGSDEGNTSYTMNRRFSKYCNARDAALDRCEIPSDARMIDADVSADTIDPETLDEDMIGAAMDRCRNIVGLPSPMQTGDQFNSVDGRLQINAKMTGDARSLMSFAMCDYLVALRTELPEESLRAWAEQVVKRITGGVGMPPPAGSCSSLGGGGSLVPSDCNPFQPGVRIGGTAINAQQASNMNALYSALASFRDSNGQPLPHHAIMATVLNTMEETAGGVLLVERNGNCRTNLSGPSNCYTPFQRRMYNPTGVGVIQWSGWPGDAAPWQGGAAGGEGSNLARAVNPQTGQNFQKCDLVPDSQGGCAGSSEQAMQANGYALLANLQQNPAIVNALMNSSDINDAADITVNDWIRPGTDRNARMRDIGQAYLDPSNNLGSGNCTGADPMMSGTTPPTGTTPQTGTTPPADDSLIVRTSTGGTTTPTGGNTTNLTSPMRGAVQMTDCFGWRATDSRGARPHRGNDLISDDPTVYAAGAGTVRMVQYRGGYGLTVMIEHDDGRKTYYNHLANGSVRVSEGQRVVAGTPLATMGATGGNYGVHLDFEVQNPDGMFINPEFAVANMPTHHCGTNNGTQPLYAISPQGQPQQLVGLDGREFPTDLTFNGEYVGTYPGQNGFPTGGGCGATADLGLNLDAEHISQLELLKLVSEYRFTDPGWVEFVMSSAGRVQLIRDFLAIQATRNFLGWQSFDRQQQTLAVTAAWAAAEADRAYRTKVPEHDN